MQRVNLYATRSAHYDPVQRSEQWKQVILKEEKSLVENGVDLSNGVWGNTSNKKPPRGGGGGVGAGGGYRPSPYAQSTARSALSLDTGRLRSSRSSVAKSTGRSRRSRRTGRSTARSTASGYSLSSSIPSSASGMTSVALARLERLEKSLDDERLRRVNAEEQLEQLRKLVDQRLSNLEKTGK